jgi:hypothetical protein
MPEASPLRVDYVADYYHRYPGETVTFYTRVSIQQPLLGFTVKITLPAELTVSDYQVLSADGDAMPLVEFGSGGQHVTWVVVEELEAGSEWEYQVQAQVAPVFQDATKESRAVAYSELREGEQVSAEETVSVAVAAKGDYLRHLPALYQSDELMGRFLMLFESFWAPVEGQIDHLPLYFDPKMTPPDFLPWLASWFDVILDQRLSEEQHWSSRRPRCTVGEGPSRHCRNTWKSTPASRWRSSNTGPTTFAWGLRPGWDPASPWGPATGPTPLPSS